MVKTLVVILILGLLLVGSVTLYSYSTNEVKDTLEEIQPQKVVNPSAGETWDSVEDYVYRNKKQEIVNG